MLGTQRHLVVALIAATPASTQLSIGLTENFLSEPPISVKFALKSLSLLLLSLAGRKRRTQS